MEIKARCTPNKKNNNNKKKEFFLLTFWGFQLKTHKRERERETDVCFEGADEKASN